LGNEPINKSFINPLRTTNTMAKAEFQDIRFDAEGNTEGNGKDKVRLVFLRIFEMHIDRQDLERIGKYELSEHTIDFPDLSEKEMQNKLYPLLDKAFRGLQNITTGRDAVYVHQNSGIPLIGTLYFGIVDRGTNIIEVKPITGCNINCPFCSVSEGDPGRKQTDFVVEDEYLAAEVERLVDFKQEEQDVPIDVFINTHGEPLLYANIVPLVRKLRMIDNVNVISIITNGVVLTEELADELIRAGLTQLNLSVNAFDAEKAKELAGNAGYNIEKVLDVARHVAQKIRLVIAPVWIKGVNDDEIPKLAAFSKEVGAELGIQNYMVHKRGKKITDQVSWEEFYAQLEEWEQQTGIALKQKDHTLTQTRVLDKPFRKGDVVNAEIVCAGRARDEMIAAAKGRAICVVNCSKERGAVKVRILKDKDNVFVGEML
jgi:uncharacterized Fe-S cluster-containing radical SAM superfamily enzyme